MLVASMTDLEALNEVAEDLPRLQRSTDRWADDYFKIRRKLKIPRNQPYLKKFPSTYKNKNPWVTVLYKPEEDERVKYTVTFFSYTSYYSTKGLQVFALAHSQMSLYNGHLFGRYNERLSLGIGTASDRVDHFFAKNRVLAPSEYERDGIKTLVGICPLGYILGEQREDLACNIYKTFIAPLYRWTTPRQPSPRPPQCPRRLSIRTGVFEHTPKFSPRPNPQNPPKAGGRGVIHHLSKIYPIENHIQLGAQ